MKISKKILSILLIVALGATSFYFFYMLPRRTTPILMYHYVNGDKSNTLNVSRENFSRQMKFLKDSSYSVISLDELVRRIKKGEGFIPKTVVITFDDGMEDNYLNAFPVLAKYDMPASMFLITGYIGTKEGYLKWDQVRLMMENGIDFGGHTRNDVYLPAVEETHRLWEEVAGCKKDIELETGRSVKYFCYPIGGFNEKVKLAVQKAGYEGACTTNRGFDRCNRDVYELNRVKVTNSDMTSPFHFRAKLSGFYNIFRRLRKGY